MSLISQKISSVSIFSQDNSVYIGFHPSLCCKLGYSWSPNLWQCWYWWLMSFQVCRIRSWSSLLCHPPFLLVFPFSLLIVNTVSSNDSSHSWNTWPLRLGHPYPNAMKTVLQSSSIWFSNKIVFDFCSAWCVVKSQVTFLYYVTFIDSHSRITWIYLLKSKSEALTIFQQFKYDRITISCHDQSPSRWLGWEVQALHQIPYRSKHHRSLNLSSHTHTIKMVWLNLNIDI